MARAWETLDRVATPDGVLELRRRGAGDFLIAQDGRVLMNSHARRSEEALGTRAVEALSGRAAPRLLVAGLGMGCTLRAVLDGCAPDARVEVAELNETVVAWCRGPLGGLTAHAVADPRVTVRIADVGERIASAAPGRFDAIVLDLYFGPPPGAPPGDPLFGRRAIARVASALAPAGVLGVWAEDVDPAFTRALQRAGFRVATWRPGRGGRRHGIYVAQRNGSIARPPKE